MIANILVLSDGKDAHAPSIVRAASIARAAHAELELFSVVHEPLLEGYMGNTAIYEPLRRRLLDERRAELEAVASDLAAKGLRCKARAVWGRHRHEIVAGEAVAHRADLVAMSPADAAKGLSHADWKLVSTCPAPVLVVNGDSAAPYRHIVAAVDPYQEHGKPAELDTAILRNARVMADISRGQLRVVHCFATIEDMVAADFIELPAAQAEVALERDRREALSRLVDAAGLPAESATLIAGRPETVLAALAERGEADLLVLGTAARGRVREFFIGSTAERLLHDAKADVLIVKPPGVRVTVAHAEPT
jgi:universal stress protein E